MRAPVAAKIGEKTKQQNKQEGDEKEVGVDIYFPINIKEVSAPEREKKSDDCKEDIEQKDCSAEVIVAGVVHLAVSFVDKTGN